MADIGDGTLHFKATLDSDELVKQVDIAVKKIENFSDVSVRSGRVIDESFHTTTMAIDDAFGKIDKILDTNKQSISELKIEYDKLSEIAANAFNIGDDKEYRRIQNELLPAIRQEIRTREKVIKETEEQAVSLAKCSEKLEKEGIAAEKAANAHVSFRTQLRNVREELLLMEQAGKKNTDEYRALEQEAGRLAGALSNVNKQTQILGHNQSGFQGVLSGITGITGAFSAVTGAMSMFADKNEDLQQIMVKVQSLMAITIGLQQVQQMLHEKSAFRIVILSKVTQVWKNAQMALNVQLGLSKTLATGLMTMGIGLLIAGIITLVSKYKDLKKEQEAIKKTTIEFNTQLAKEQRVVNDLFSAYKKINPETEKHRKVKDAIIDRYGEYIKHLIDEKGNITDIGEALRIVNDRLQEQIALKIRNQAIEGAMTNRFNKYTEGVDSMMEQIKKKGGVSDPEKMGEIRKYLNSQLSVFLNADNKGISQAVSDISQTLQKDFGLKNLYAGIGENIGFSINNLANNMREANKEVADVKTQFDGIISELVNVDDLINGKKGAEKEKDGTERIINETTRLKLENKQREIDLMADSEEKRIAQIELNYDREIALIKQKEKEWSDAQKGELTKEQSNLLKGAETLIVLKKEENIAAKEKEELEKLISEYSSYLAQKTKLDEEYFNDLALLRKQKSNTTDESELAELDRIIVNRTTQYDKDEKNIGDDGYDNLLAEFASFEQKKQSIVDKYSEKRSVVMQREKDLHIELNNAKTDNERTEIEKRIEENKKLQTVLNLKESKDIEKITVDDLMDSDSWNQLFGNLDKLTASEMIKLRNKIESDWEKLDLSPEQLNALRDKINEVTDKIEKKNPFLALADAIERYKKGENGVDFKDVMKSTAASLELIGGTFDAVVGGLKDMGVAMDEETEEILNNISNIIDGASKIAEGIATNNPLSIIQGSIGLLTSAVDLFDSKSRRAQREIRKHQEALKKLELAYSDLERAANKALGDDRYSSQKDSIENLKKQNAELAGMIENEGKKKKKKRDQGKIDDWGKAIKDNEHAIEDAINNLREQILGLDAASAAQQLGDAFIEAFKDGENAVEAFGKKADEIVAGIMKKMLIEKLLEKPMGQIFDKYSSQWYDDKGNFVGYDKVMKDAGMMGGEMKGLASGFAQAMENLPEEIKKYFLGDTPEDIDTSLTGAIKGVSEETASMVGGQMNAMRINQMEATALLRQQLMHLATIAHNTSYNKHLESIDNKLDNLNKGDSLRSQGLS